MSCLNRIWKFVYIDGADEKIVIDPLLVTRELAQQRAVSELIRNGYRRVYRFVTSRTDLDIRQTIRVGGVTMLITSLDFSIGDGTRVTVTGVRYGS